MTLFVEELIVKSRDRVKAYGEVFTPREMVEQMLDLVGDNLGDSEDFLDKTFLEPAAGDGNFLIAILRRKLHGIVKWYPRDQWSECSLFALASIYGIELLDDNHVDAKNGMYDEFVKFHLEQDIPHGAGTGVFRAARFIIDANIVRGNTLTGLDPNGNDIQLSWWNRVNGVPGMVQREPFTFASLRGQGFDFTVYHVYDLCMIDRVHEGMNTGA